MDLPLSVDYRVAARPTCSPGELVSTSATEKGWDSGGGSRRVEFEPPGFICTIKQIS